MNKINNIENSQSIQTNGSSLVGYVEVTYGELCKAFGEPTYKEPSADGKVQKEWNLEFETADGNLTVATIYDYCAGERGYLEPGYRWHVGGYKKGALELVEEALSMSRSGPNIKTFGFWCIAT